MAPNEDPPFGIFRGLYTLLTWASVGLMAVITVWLFFELVQNSPVGTTRSARLEQAEPTRTALALQYPTPEGRGLTTLPQVCLACHRLGNQGGDVGPDLSRAATVALERIADPAYRGAATTAEEYILESIVAPDAFVVAGFAEPSQMPANGGVTDPTLIPRIVEFLMERE